MDQRIAVGRQIGHFVAMTPHRLQHADQRGRHIQPDGVPDSAGLAGGVRQDEGDALIVIGQAAESGESQSQAGDASDPVPDRSIVHHLERRPSLLLPRTVP